MDLLLGFESLDNDLPLLLYSSQRSFDAASHDFHRSCSDPDTRPVANGASGANDTGGLWLDASSAIAQSSWQHHDPFTYSFAFDDILNVQGLQQSPEDTPSTAFTTSSDSVPDFLDSENGRHGGSFMTYPSVDEDREWSSYIPASLSSPMRALDFIQHNHTSLPAVTNKLSHGLAVPEGSCNIQPESATITPSLVSLGLVESGGTGGPGMDMASSAVCGSLMDFEVPPFLLSAAISSLENTPNAFPMSDGLQTDVSGTTTRTSFKTPSLHGWSDPHDNAQSSTRPRSSMSSYSESKTLVRKQRRPLANSNLYIPIKPPTRSTATQIRAPPKETTPKPDQAPVPSTTPYIPEAPPVTQEAERTQSLRSSESDDYLPSPSPSLSGIRSSSPAVSLRRAISPAPPSRRTQRASTKRKSRRGRGKAKGSAALALAVVTQLGTSTTDDVDPVALYQEGKLDMLGIRKRKNNPIPLPIPVPNLNKKSRGRKVPYVAPGDEGEGDANSMSPGSAFYEPDEPEKAVVPAVSALKASSAEGDSYGVSTRGRRRGSVSMSAPVDPLADKRTYVCDVAGCGKCFVRGEHLKRHVRSIHTYEKPHMCPYDGCDKSFSRRDNLGQHVRIHLQP